MPFKPGNKDKKVSLYFKYPSLKEMKSMTPKERVVFIDKKFQKNLVKIKLKLGTVQFEIIGKKRRPGGIKIAYNEPGLSMLLKLPYINPLMTTGLYQETSTVKADSYFCFKLIFQIQIEGKKKGIQTIEERFVLVKSKDWEKAEARVIKEFKDKEEPYLNQYGEFVRWKFKSIEESYHTFIESKEEFNKPVEVFSKLKGRRLKPEDTWDGKY